MCWKWKYPLVNGLLKSNNWLIVISTDNVYVEVCENEEKAKKKKKWQELQGKSDT